MDDFDEFQDPEFKADNEKLAPLLKQNGQIAKFMVWYRLHKFFQKSKYVLFNNLRMTSQVIHNRGYVYLIDALNTLSVQPGLVWRLFERKKTPREGIYPVWLNVNGEWQNIVVDDQVPIFGDRDSKTKFFFTSPTNHQKEIWHVLLEKAVAKVYGGFERLHCGLESWMMRDLTGAPHITYDVPYIPPNKQIKKREMEHMDAFWQKLFRRLRKGYVMSVEPRKPTQIESLNNKKLKIANKKYYMSNGLYSGHNYAIVTIREVIDSQGNKDRIIKLRNPWMGEIWEGKWSHNSDLWTDELRSILAYNPAENGHSEFWMDLKSFMSYFETLNVYKVNPEFMYNSICLKGINCANYRSVVRISVPAKGKYTFTTSQRDIRFYGQKQLVYSPVKLTLGQIEQDQFKLLSHTSTQKSRDTFIRKVIDKGEYYLLVEKENPPQLQQLCQQYKDTYKDFHNINVSSYGPRTCGLKTISDREKNKFVFDYLSYFGWKGFSEQRVGQKVSDCNINFYDGSWNNVSLYLLNIPDTIIYAFRNQNEFGVELNSKFAGIFNKEIVGPEGRKSFEQEFSMNSGSCDVFILRDLEYSEADKSGLVNNKFQIKSVVGRKYFGEKDNPDSFAQLKGYLLDYKASRKLCEVEKKSGRSKIGIFDMFNGIKKIEIKSEIVKGKIKKYTQTMKVEDYQDLVDMEEVERLEEEFQADYERQVRQREAEEVERKKILAKKIQEGKIQMEHQNDEEYVYEEEESVIDFEEDENVLQLGNADLILQKSMKKKEKGASILKNLSRTQEQEARNLEALQRYVEEVQVMDEKDLSNALTLTSDQLLLVDNNKLKQMLKYFGIQAFLRIYSIDNQMLGKIVEKLGGNNPAEQRSLGQKIMQARVQDPAQSEMERLQQEEYERLMKEQEELKRLTEEKLKLLQQQEAALLQEQQLAAQAQAQAQQPSSPNLPPAKKQAPKAMDYLSIDHAIKYNQKNPRGSAQPQPQQPTQNQQQQDAYQQELEEQKRLERQIQKHLNNPLLKDQFQNDPLFSQIAQQHQQTQNQNQNQNQNQAQNLSQSPKNSAKSQLSQQDQELQQMLQREKEQQALLEKQILSLTQGGPLGETLKNIDPSQLKDVQSALNQVEAPKSAISAHSPQINKKRQEFNMSPLLNPEGLENKLYSPSSQQIENNQIRVNKVKIDHEVPLIDRAHRLKPETSLKIQDKIQKKLEEIRRVQNANNGKVSNLAKGQREKSAQPTSLRGSFNTNRGRTNSIDLSYTSQAERVYPNMNDGYVKSEHEENLKKEKEKLDEMKMRLEQRKQQRIKFQEEYERKKQKAQQMEENRKNKNDLGSAKNKLGYYGDKVSRGSTPGSVPMQRFNKQKARASYNVQRKTMIGEHSGREYDMRLRDFSKQAEFERKKLRQDELERRRQKLRDSEMERQRIDNRERQRQQELERQRVIMREREQERERLEQIERQRREEEERQLAAQIERKRQEDLERQRLDELERMQRMELDRQRQIQLERERNAELERQRKAELERQRMIELERQRQQELEDQRIIELERQKQAELERKQREQELERQRRIEMDRQKQAELERTQRQEELERQRRVLRERQILIDQQKQKEKELEEQRQKLRERQRKIDRENQRIAEMERKRMKEQEEQIIERERQRQAELQAQNELKRLEEERRTVELQNSLRKKREEEKMKNELQKRVEILRDQHFLNQEPQQSMRDSGMYRVETKQYNTAPRSEANNSPHKPKRIHAQQVEDKHTRDTRIKMRSPVSNANKQVEMRGSSYVERGSRGAQFFGSRTERKNQVSNSFSRKDSYREMANNLAAKDRSSQNQDRLYQSHYQNNPERSRTDRLLNNLQQKIRKNQESIKKSKGKLNLRELNNAINATNFETAPYAEKRKRLGSYNQDMAKVNLRNQYSSSKGLPRNTESRLVNFSLTLSDKPLTISDRRISNDSTPSGEGRTKEGMTVSPKEICIILDMNNSTQIEKFSKIFKTSNLAVLSLNNTLSAKLLHSR